MVATPVAPTIGKESEPGTVSIIRALPSAKPDAQDSAMTHVIIIDLIKLKWVVSMPSGDRIARTPQILGQIHFHPRNVNRGLHACQLNRRELPESGARFKVRLLRQLFP